MAEKTVGADDVTGANNCPLFMRISAVGMMPWEVRTKYMSAEPAYGGIQKRKSERKVNVPPHPLPSDV